MGKNLDKRSKDILNFRPNIVFVEPEQEEVPPTPVAVPVVENVPERVQATAKAVNALAEAVQAKVDRKAKDIKIKLDPIVDLATIMSMQRHFPDDDPNFITYDQYKRCRDEIREQGDLIALQAVVTPATQEEDFNIGGFGTPEARDGGLRPELSDKAMVIKPIDLAKFQLSLMKILMNFLWRTFILKPVKKIPGAGRILPKQLPKLNKNEKAVLKHLEKHNLPIL